MPQVTVAVYMCDKCGFELYQEVTARTFMPLFTCESPAVRAPAFPSPSPSPPPPPPYPSNPTQCKAKKNQAGALHMVTRGSRFVKFQELRIQELPEEVPVGHVPRSIVCHVRFV